MVDDILDAIKNIILVVLAGWAALFIGLLIIAPLFIVIILLTIFVD